MKLAPGTQYNKKAGGVYYLMQATEGKPINLGRITPYKAKPPVVKRMVRIDAKTFKLQRV